MLKNFEFMFSLYNGQNRISVYGYSSNPINQNAKITNIWTLDKHKTGSFYKMLVEIENAIRDPTNRRHNSASHKVILEEINKHNNDRKGMAIILRTG